MFRRSPTPLSRLDRPKARLMHMTPERALPAGEAPDKEPRALLSTSSTQPKPQASATTPGVRDPRMLRYVFNFFWIFALPLVLAVLGVWLLTPSPASLAPGGLRIFVGDQQIPSGIVLFTVFAMGLWR